MNSSLHFFQLFDAESSTYTYLLGDMASGECALIDTVLGAVDRDLRLVSELGLKVKYILETHIHADHISAADEIRQRTGAKTAVSEKAPVVCCDLHLHDGQKLNLGALEIQAFATPGHTDTCMTFHCADMLFTGDTLLIHGNGRTDFQSGSSEQLYDSVHQKIFKFADETKVYPAHDYKGMTSSTVGLERNFNPRLGGGKTKAEFCQMMADLHLDLPKKISEAVPANLNCGKLKTP